MEKVRNTVLGMSVSSLLNRAHTPSGFSMERFNRHSAAVAILSDLTAQRVPVEYPEGAFVAGLLHDIGRLLIAIGLPKEFEKILSLYNSSDVSWIDCEQQVLGFSHPELSSAALMTWKVPELIQSAAAQHHEPVQCSSNASTVSLGWVVRAADQFINSTGETVAVARKTDESGAVWLESLGLDADQIDQLLDDYAAEHNAIGQYFR
jgi:HD-like signal output (HDOD) protein